MKLGAAKAKTTKKTTIKKMTTKKITAIILFTAASVFAAGTDIPAPTQVHRFLLVAGANNGGAERVLLRYAVSDARAFSAVLSEMGGVEERNSVFLNEPSIAEMHRGFANIEQKLGNPRYKTGRREIIVYYSGHADEQGLRLGREVMQWADFRRQVDNLSADLKVAVVDACGSGAITRIKGGVARPAFLFDASSDMTGYAFITSSSESEVSQESDRLRGSFFTHALVSGLRGAADMTGSGTVTLSEAYQFAFNETLHSTQSTMGGVQHPSRDMNLTGTGDIVMTDLRHSNSGLTLDAELGGRFYIRDSRNFLVAELYKPKGRTIELGLPAGKYTIRFETSHAIENVMLIDGGKTLLTQNMFRPVRRERTALRGDGTEESADEDDYDGIYYYDDDDASGNQHMAGAAGLQTADAPPILKDKRMRDESGSRHDVVDAVDTLHERQAYSNPMLDSARAAPFRFDSYIIYGYSDVPAHGLQLSLVLNEARAEYVGTQIAVAGNIARKDMSGTQLGGGFNFASGHFHGLQVACGLNMTQKMTGIQMGAINIASDTLDGIQGGAMNIAKNAGYIQGGALNIARDVGYAQGGAMNIAGNAGYAQVGAMNVARDVGYAQGGAMNIAGNVGYAQVGVVNIAGNVKYAQGGALNIAGRVERQIGVVNIAKYSEKTPVGLLNIAGNGVINTAVCINELGRPVYTFRSGTQWFYSAVEYSHHMAGIAQADGKWWEPMFSAWGMGTQFGRDRDKRFFMNFDVVWINPIIGNAPNSGNSSDDDGGSRHGNIIASVHSSDCPHPYHQRESVPDSGSGSMEGDYEMVSNVKMVVCPLCGEHMIIIDDDGNNRHWFHGVGAKIRLGANYRFLPYAAVTGGVTLTGMIESGNGEFNNASPSSRYLNASHRGHLAKIWPGVYFGLTVGKF